MARARADRRRRAARLAYASGVLLLLSGTTGSGVLWQFLLHLVAQAVPLAWFQRLVLYASLVLALLAALGGFTVLVGGWVVRRKSARVGAFLIGLGAGFGLFGVLLNVAVLLATGGNVLGYLLGFVTSLGGVGIGLAVAARTLADPPKVHRVVRRIKGMTR